MYYGHGMGAGWSLIVFVVVLPLLLIAAGFVGTLIRHSPDSPARPGPAPDAERVLADRFARGEIDAEEYEGRLHVLRAARP
jgi:putative membrane protein